MNELVEKLSMTELASEEYDGGTFALFFDGEGGPPAPPSGSSGSNSGNSSGSNSGNSSGSSESNTGSSESNTGSSESNTGSSESNTGSSESNTGGSESSSGSNSGSSSDKDTDTAAEKLGWDDTNSSGGTSPSMEMVAVEGESQDTGETVPEETTEAATEPGVCYVVAGDGSVCGSDWDTMDRENIMTQTEDGTYTWTASAVEAGDHVLAVYVFGDRKENSYGDEEIIGDTCTFTVAQECAVTVVFDPAAGLAEVSGDYVQVTLSTDTAEGTLVSENPVPAAGMGGNVWMFAFIALLIAVVVAAIALLVGRSRREKQRKEEERKERKRRAMEQRKAEEAAAAAAAAAAQAPVERTELHDSVPAAAVAVAAPINVVQPATGMRSAVFQNLGGRKDQQDSYGMTDPALYGQQGVMAIVADGMGGLANGKAVSSALVNTFLSGFRSGSAYGKAQEQLLDLAINANQKINQMLAGADRSGSTLLSVIVREGRLHFLTAGDSRIYLFRSGALLQLNREHIYQEELAVKAVNRQVHMAQVTEDRQAHSLTSFFGIGNLPHVDRNVEGIRLVPGDRILLCSDGVFGTLTQEQMEYALGAEDVKESARLMRDMIVDINKPYQDNNTGLILEYLG